MMCSFLMIFIVSLFIIDILAEDVAPSNEALTSNDEQVPDFVKKLNPESLQQLANILEDSSITKQQQDDAIKEWADEQGGEIQKLFTEEMNELHNMIETMNVKIDESNMDDMAKDAAHKIQEIFSDMNITVGENVQKFSNIINSLSIEDQNQVNEFLASMIKPTIDLMQQQIPL